MRLYLGVDLGSTTSKAVLVDDDERVVGRGITNTRSNYDVAVEIARRDAMTDARLALALRLLGRDGHAVAEAFWVESDLHRREALRQTCRATASAIPGEGPRLAPAVDDKSGRDVRPGKQKKAAGKKPAASKKPTNNAAATKPSDLE